jgi:hypothetical protein
MPYTACRHVADCTRIGDIQEEILELGLAISAQLGELTPDVGQAAPLEELHQAQ